MTTHRICETCQHVLVRDHNEPCRSCQLDMPAAPLWERGSYTADERRVVDFIVEQTGGLLGAGDDPIGFLIASYRLAIEQRNDAIRALNRRVPELLNANSEMMERNRILRRQVEGKDLIIDAMAVAVERERLAAAAAAERAQPHVHKDGPFCSFCGKAQRDVRKLIDGPVCFICDECVDLCVDIIAQEAKAA